MVTVGAPARPRSRRRSHRVGRFDADGGVSVRVRLPPCWVPGCSPRSYLSAGDRTEVLVLAHDVGRLEVIERSDLRVVRMSNDADVESIDAGRFDDFVGRVTGVDLVAGSLLAEGQVLPPGRDLLGADEAVVGVLLGPGDSPVRSLRRGTPVLVVVRPPAGSQGDTEEIEGWVFDASGEPLNTRERPIELAVPRDKAGLISAAAADQRVTIVALAE